MVCQSLLSWTTFCQNSPTMTHPSWVALQDMVHSFIELDKAVIHGSVWPVFCDCCFPLSALWWGRIKGLWKLPDGRDWLRGKLGLVLMGGAILSKSLVQFSVDGWGCVPSLLFDLGQNYGGGNEDNGNATSFKRSCIQCPCPCSRPLSTHTSTSDSWTLTVKSGSVSCGVTAPFSWVHFRNQQTKMGWNGWI